MRSTKKAVLILTALALVCVIGTGVVIGMFFAGGNDFSSFFNLFEGGRQTVQESEPLALDGVSALAVDCIAGDVTVVAGDEARAELSGSLWTTEQKDKYLDVQQKDGTLTVRFDTNDGFWGWMNTDLHLTVYLPQDSAISLSVANRSGKVQMQALKVQSATVKNTSGYTEITGCTGTTMDVDTTSGNTQISGAAFDCIGINCVSGNVNVEDVSAALSVSSTSGSVNIKDVTGALDIRNTSGGVSIDQQEPGPVSVGIISGNVTLVLDAGAAFDLSASTTSGHIRSDFDITVSGSAPSEGAGNDISGKIGGGGVSVVLTTVSGNIDIIKR